MPPFPSLNPLNPPNHKLGSPNHHPNPPRPDTHQSLARTPPNPQPHAQCVVAPPSILHNGFSPFSFPFTHAAQYVAALTFASNGLNMAFFLKAESPNVRSQCAHRSGCCERCVWSTPAAVSHTGAGAHSHAVPGSIRRKMVLPKDGWVSARARKAG